jgi:hypothetical protein
VKRFLAALAGAIGLGALLHRRQRQRAAQHEPTPAEELRAKLDQADERSDAGEREPQAVAVPASGRDEPSSTTDVEARRRDVHERARKAADELQ